jgi:hypothetical protein
MNRRSLIVLLIVTVTVFPTSAPAQLIPGRVSSSLTPQQQAALRLLELRQREALILREQQLEREREAARQRRLEKERRALALPKVKRSGLELNQVDLLWIRQHPEHFPLMFQAYDKLLRESLGKGFRGLNDEGYAAVFACLVAYQLKPYRAMGDPSPKPPNDTLEGLMRTEKLVCDEYCLFAAQLYKTFPASYRSRVTMKMVGWNGGYFGNHAQLLVEGTGVPLLLDPTIGMVARTDYKHLRAGDRLPRSEMWATPFQHSYPAVLAAEMRTFAQKVETAVLTGLYPLSTQLYDRTVVAPSR